MPAPDLCTEAEIADLVHRFYARVRADALLGPVFDTHIDDWANARMGARANALAGRIAQSLWLGYQLHRGPAWLPEETTTDG